MSILPLPAQQRRFIGRRAELQWLVQALESVDAGIITITGLGGVGKTTLCLEAASLTERSFADGTAFVTFAGSQDAERVADAILRHIAPDWEGDGSAIPSVFAVLADRELLLVLDNVEVIEPAWPFLGQIRQNCPNVVLLIASRRRTRLTDEVVYQIDPLPVPAPDLGLSLDAALSVDAINLFLDRATRAYPQFTLTSKNVEAIAQICRNLDGIPLSIELAAARVGTVGVHALASGIGSRLELAAHGPLDAVARHQSVSDAIQWGYDLLSPEHQHLFRQMAVFTGGFSFDGMRHMSAMRSVAPIAPQDSAWWFDAIQTLVDFQLVQFDGINRYRLLDTIREFGLNQLNAAGEREDVERARFDWCLALAQQADRLLRGDLQPGEHIPAADELDNIRAALAWSLAHAQSGTELDRPALLANAMWNFWSWHGYWVEATDWLGQAVTIAATQISVPMAVAHMYRGHGLSGDIASSIKSYEHSLAIFRALEDDAGVAVAIGSLASAHRVAGHTDLAMAHGREAIARLRDLPGDRRASIVTTHIVLADIALQANDPATARAELDQASTLAAEIGSEVALRSAICAIARLNRTVGRYPEAVSALEAVIEQAVATGDRNSEFRDLVELALARIEIGVIERAASDLVAALEIMQDLNYRDQTFARALAAASRIHALRGNLIDAARLLATADHLLEHRQLILQPSEVRQLNRERNFLRQKLGPARFATEVAIGQVTGLDRSRRIAMAIADTPAQGSQASREAVDTGRGLLSPREFEVLQALVEGKSDRAIGESLGVKTTTARTLVQRVREKLGADNRHEAVAIAVAQGLVKPAVLDYA
ncbi:MAG TPA: LuxR C-terminal-related transcriptional regulator [Thermomicrobiales bacterium]|nr:LuxR C-terminal-related transcriptional regulator [Thermomicrobiales bacterium]